MTLGMSDTRWGSTLQLLNVILGLLESCARSRAIFLDGLDLPATAQSVDHARRKIGIRIELNPVVPQERIELRLESRQGTHMVPFRAPAYDHHGREEPGYNEPQQDGFRHVAGLSMFVSLCPEFRRAEDERADGRHNGHDDHDVV